MSTTQYAIRRTAPSGVETIGVAPSLDHAETYVHFATKVYSEKDTYDVVQRTVSDWTPLDTTTKETTDEG